MSNNKTNTITLIYCGNEFDHYTINGNVIHRYFFIDAQYTFYEFFDQGGYNIVGTLSCCKLGTSINITWKRYGETWRKIILDAEPISKKPTTND